MTGEGKSVELSERQKATLATAITVLSAVVILAAVAALLWLLGLFLAKFSHVFLPLAVAGVIALILKPFFDWLVERARLHPVLALAVLLLAILLPIVGVGWFFGDLLVSQVSGLIDKIPHWWQGVTAWFQARLPKLKELWDQYQVGDRLQAATAGNEDSLVSGLQSVGWSFLSAGANVFGALGALFSWAVLPVYVGFLLLIDPHKVIGSAGNMLPFLKAETRDDVTYLVQEFVKIVVAFFRGQLLIAFLQGLLYAVGFWAVGLNYGFVLGLLLGFLNVIPYLGSIVGLGLSLPLAFFQEGGGTSTAIAVLVVFTVVQFIEGHLLTPKIMGDRTGLHPMVIIVAVFFWGSALNGITGLVLAIPLTAFFVVFWRLAREKYIQEVV
jgi:predicted PurR-regulated permease PerM